MAKQPNKPQSQWREFDALTKLQILANFYPNLSELSSVTGVPYRSLRQTLHNIAAGKKVRNVFNETFKQGISKARHRMTDSLRRIDTKYKAGEYEAPVIKYSGGVVVPTRPNVFIGYANKNVQSFWVHYRVEHLPYEDQREIARILFDWSMETGQFNDFRFEYVTRSDYYRETSSNPRRTWKDTNLQEQADITKFVRLSTTHTPLLEIAPDQNSDRFLDFFDDSVRDLKQRGLVQVVDLCFTWRKDYADYKPINESKPKAKVKKKFINKRGK